MKNFYVTFGIKYESVVHPKVDYADPGGYVLIRAKSYEEAREKAFKELGQFWAGLYDSNNMDFSYYPKGVLKEL